MPLPDHEEEEEEEDLLAALVASPPPLFRSLETRMSDDGRTMHLLLLLLLHTVQGCRVLHFLSQIY